MIVQTNIESLYQIEAVSIRIRINKLFWGIILAKFFFGMSTYAESILIRTYFLFLFLISSQQSELLYCRMGTPFSLFHKQSQFSTSFLHLLMTFI